MMGEIYQSASEVIVYIPLLPELKGIQDDPKQRVRAVEFIENTSELQKQMLLWARQKSEHPILKMISGMLREETKQSYWRRLWTIQERALARSIITISGAMKLDLDHLELVKKTGSELKAHFDGLSSATSPPLTRIEVRRISMLQLGDDPRLEADGSAAERSLIDVFSKIRSDLGYTDPRDLIYGVIGLVAPSKQHWSSVRTDYSLCTLCVWRNATIRTIRDTRNLNILRLCGFYRQGSSPENSILTWVPCWSKLLNSTILVNQYSLVPHTALSAAPVMEFSSCMRWLKASGFILGQIDTLAWTSQGDRNQDQFDRARELLDVLRSFSSSAFTNVLLQSESLEDFADIMANLQFPTPNSAALKELCVTSEHFPLAAIDSPATAQLVCDMLDDNWLMSISGHQYSFLGIGFSPHMKQGDLVCGVYGCQTPLVVRRQVDGARIIGACLINKFGERNVLNELMSNKIPTETFNFT